MGRVTQLLDQNTSDGFGIDESDSPGFSLADLTPAERAEYRRRLGDVRKTMDACRRSRRDEVETGMTIHGPGYHEEPYCGGY